MTRPFLAALASAVALAASPAAAQFEGRLDYVMKVAGEKDASGKPRVHQGKMTFYVSPAGARSEMSGSMPDGKGGTHPINFVTIWKASEPKRTVMLNVAQKSYSVFESDGDRERSRERPRIERIGSDRVAGYACDKARITEESGDGQVEVCVTKALGKAPRLGRLAQEEDDDIFAELRKAGLDGIPVSWRALEKDGDHGMTMELVAARKQAVPASMFSVPAGYKETGMMGVFASPEQQQQLDAAMKQMEEQMKNMPPEQRKQMEEMMKQYGTGKK
jgi:hypothetical protein